MTGAELDAGKRWVEQRFAELTAEFGAVGKFAHGDRWRKLGTRFKTQAHCMNYYVELQGHIRRGKIAFRDVDLEDAGAGETMARKALERQIRKLLRSLREGETGAVARTKAFTSRSDRDRRP